MVKEFKLPDLGEGIASGDVVNVLVSEGDQISAEQTVVEIETDKAVLEVPCPFGGRVSRVHVSKGDKASVGDTLVTIEADGEAGVKEPAGEPPKKSKEDKSAKPEPSEGRAPRRKEPAESGRGRDEPGDRHRPAVKDDGKKKEVEGKREPQVDARPVTEAKKPDKLQADKPPGKPADDVPIPAGPATRRLARELGVDLKRVAAQHPGTRLTEDHVRDFVREGLQRGTPASAGAGHVGELPDFSQWGPVERVAFSSLQRKTAEHLSASWLTAPHVTQFDDADITALETLRKRYAGSGRSDVKLTVTAFVLKAAALGLKTYPQFNASLDLDAGELVLKKYYHVGVAVDTEAGLIVPVIRDVDKKRVLDIAAEMNELAERTRQRKVAIEELRGGTFTVTNLGMYGIDAFTPIVNHPEVAILGLARGRQQPVLDNGEWKARLMLPLCLSYDHRVINGADGARFIRKLAELLEDPELLLLQG